MRRAVAAAIVLLIANYVWVILQDSSELHPDAGLDVFELTSRYGYTVERHENVETEDGYLLELHRLRRQDGGGVAAADGKLPVLLMHGIICSSIDWVMNGPRNSLAYALVDLGYDVWLANARGNLWSRRHSRLDPDVDRKEFWDFSFHEIGYYDTPAMIDYILATTSQKKLYYVGYSQGTTTFFVMASERPEYNSKIQLMSALGPAGALTDVFSPIFRLLSAIIYILQYLDELLRVYEFPPHSDLVRYLGMKLCHENNFVSIHVCMHAMSHTQGYDFKQMNRTMLPVFMSNIPAGSATKQLLHYGQMIRSGLFRRFDHLGDANKERYGQAVPPEYNLTKVTAPVALHYAKNDWVISIKDVENLKRTLPNVVVDHKIDYENFNHIDYMWASEAYDMLYKDVIKYITQH